MNNPTFLTAMTALIDEYLASQGGICLCSAIKGDHTHTTPCTCDECAALDAHLYAAA